MDLYQSKETSGGRESDKTDVISITHQHLIPSITATSCVQGLLHNGPSGKRGSSSPPHKQAAVYLGLLCALLLTTIIVLCVHYYTASLSCNVLRAELQILRDSFDTVLSGKDQLQTQNGVLTSTQVKLQELNSYMTLAKEQLERDYMKLIASKHQLQSEHRDLAASLVQLERDYKDLLMSNKQLERDYLDLTSSKNQLQRDYQTLTLDREQLQREHLNITAAHGQLRNEDVRTLETKNKLLVDLISLSETKAIVSKDLIATVRERNSLKKMLTELVNFLPVDQHCPIRDPITEERVCSPCLKGWKLFSSKCYYFSTERKSWNSGRVDCVKQGGDLVIIDSPEEQEFIRKHTPQYHSPAQRYWIGLTAQETKGIWVWVNSTQLSAGYWLNESSAVTVSGDRECVSTLRETNPARSWRDETCSSMFRWICKSPALILPA